MRRRRPNSSKFATKSVQAPDCNHKVMWNCVVSECLIWFNHMSSHFQQTRRISYSHTNDRCKALPGGTTLWQCSSRIHRAKWPWAPSSSRCWAIRKLDFVVWKLHRDTVLQLQPAQLRSALPLKCKAAQALAWWTGVRLFSFRWGAWPWGGVAENCGGGIMVVSTSWAVAFFALLKPFWSKVHISVPKQALCTEPKLSAPCEAHLAAGPKARCGKSRGGTSRKHGGKHLHEVEGNAKLAKERRLWENAQKHEAAH